IVVADLDGDGDPDVVTGGGSNPANWHENVGNGVYLVHILGTVSTLGVRVGDVDRDGDLDIVIISGGVKWCVNKGNRTFTLHDHHPSPPPRHQTTGTQGGVFDLAHLDGDGDLNVVVQFTNINANSSIVAMPNDGQFNFNQQIYIVSPTNLYVSGIHAADIDRDG